MPCGVDELIKELIDEITGIDWSPGEFPQSLANIETAPAGSWWVNVSSGGSTSTRKEAYVNARITVNLWSGTAEGRAASADSVRGVFVNTGFVAVSAGQREVKLPGEHVAYVCSLVFVGLIDTATYWVCQQQ